MEFLVIVLFVVAIVVVNFVVSRAQRRKKQGQGVAPEAGEAGQERSGTAKPPKSPRKTAGVKAQAGPRTSAEAAREANGRLDAVQHQQVYAAIAQGHPIQAVKLYAQFTGVGVRAAGAAVENLATHPQPFQPPRPAAPSPDAPAAPGPDAPAAPGDAGKTEAGNPGAGNTEAGAGDDAEAPGTSGPAGPGSAGSAPSGSPEARAAGSDRDRAAAAGDAAAPAEKSKSEESRKNEPAGKTPATPEEDEISKWVKNMRPEDF